MKKTYQMPEVEIEEFLIVDVITDSDPNDPNEVDSKDYIG